MRRALAAFGTALLSIATVQTAAAEPAPSPANAELRQILVVTRLPAAHLRLGSQYGGTYRNPQARTSMQQLANRIARDAGLAVSDDWPLPLIELNCFVMTVPEGRSLDEVIEAVSLDPAVVFAEPMQTYRTQSETAAYDDPMYPAQPLGRSWQLSALHRMATGTDVKVAVIDTGVERNHPDLAGRVATTMNFVENRPFAAERHGTGVAGVIAATANNGTGIVGVAPDARVLALRACWEQRPGEAAVCNTLSLAKALHFAIDRGAEVINMSLAGPRAELLDRLLDKALGRNISVVAAYDKSLPGGGFPASKRGVIAVADETLASPRPGVYIAPGQDVITAEPSGKWALVSGSSYSAAHVSGLYALLRSAASSRQAPPRLVTSGSGEGAIDACATLLGAARTTRVTCTGTATIARARR